MCSSISVIADTRSAARRGPRVAPSAGGRRPLAAGSQHAPDFIGIGGQRCGTSWLYACLYEHPAIWAPAKELHFFSRERNWSRGYEWYEQRFAHRPRQARAGEFSTSYLTCPDTPERVRRRYPGVRLVVSLRDPIRRAYSSYLNDIMAGALAPSTSFEDALDARPGYLADGAYAAHLERWLRYFPREQMLVLLHDELVADPAESVARLYRFLDVDETFRPSMLHRRVNAGRVPRSVGLERLLVAASDCVRRHGLGRLWWLAKRMGLGTWLRALNTDRSSRAGQGLDPAVRARLLPRVLPDIDRLESLLGRSLEEWRQ